MVRAMSIRGQVDCGIDRPDRDDRRGSRQQFAGTWVRLKVNSGSTKNHLDNQIKPKVSNGTKGRA